MPVSLCSVGFISPNGFGQSSNFVSPPFVLSHGGGLLYFSVKESKRLWNIPFTDGLKSIVSRGPATGFVIIFLAVIFPCCIKIGLLPPPKGFGR